MIKTVKNTGEFVEFDPHLILMDISLPFFNGYHWCSEIRKVSKVPIIFISSASDNFNIVMAVNMGESGSGKTTLLNILASLDKPTSGEVLLNWKSIVSIREKEISAFRRDNLGFVFQDFNLLDTFTLRDNIFLPLVLSGKDYDYMEEKKKLVYTIFSVWKNDI